VNLLIAIILTAIVSFSSYYLNRHQRTRETTGKTFDYKGRKVNKVKEVVQSRSNTIPSQDVTEGIEVLLIDYSYEVYKRKKPFSSRQSHENTSKTTSLISHVTTKFPAGTLSCMDAQWHPSVFLKY
jgi:hypothetical protein